MKNYLKPNVAIWQIQVDGFLVSASENNPEATGTVNFDPTAETTDNEAKLDVFNFIDE